MEYFQKLKLDLLNLYKDFREQDFAVWAVCLYLIFCYLKPQVTFPSLAFLPWIRLSLLAGLIYLIVKNRISFQSSHILMLVFFSIVTISAFNAHNQQIAWARYDVIYIQFVEMIFFTSCIKNIKQFKIVLTVFLLILFKMSLFGAKTWVNRGFGFTSWGISGPDGYFANSGEFSLLMAMYAIMGLGFVAGHKFKRKIYYLAPLTAVMTVLGASSRGSQLAIIAGLILMAFFLGKLNIKNILAVCLIGYVGYALFPAEQKKRFESMGDDGTSQSRLKYWAAGIDMMNRNKLSGVGYFGFADYYQDYYKTGDGTGYSEGRKEVAHNSLVETGSELGYPGLLCYLWFHFHCYRLNVKSRKLASRLKPEGLEWVPLFTTGMNVTLIVYFIGAFFMSVGYYPYIYLMMMFSQALFNCMKKIEVDKIRPLSEA